jgi:hypothetical protein
MKKTMLKIALLCATVSAVAQQTTPVIQKMQTQYGVSSNVLSIPSGGYFALSSFTKKDTTIPVNGLYANLGLNTHNNTLVLASSFGASIAASKIKPNKYIDLGLLVNSNFKSKDAKETDIAFFAIESAYRWQKLAKGLLSIRIGIAAGYLQHGVFDKPTDKVKNTSQSGFTVAANIGVTINLFSQVK